MSFFKKFFVKKEEPLPEPVDLSALVADMHSHLIPGIDDGAPHMDEAIHLITELAAMGYRKLITTPHIFSDIHRNTAAIILEGRDRVRAELKARAIDIEFDAAAEYYLDDHFEQLLERKELLTFGKNYVLFELSFVQDQPSLARAIFHMILAGYRPVLAHPERYEYWHGNFARYEELVEKDVLLALNINSLTGQYGDGVKRTAYKLIDAGMVSFLGSDCHHVGHLGLMQQARNNLHLRNLIDTGKLLNSTL